MKLTRNIKTITILSFTLLLVIILAYLIINRSWRPKAEVSQTESKSGFFNFYIGNFDYTLSDLKKFDAFFASTLGRIIGVNDYHAEIKNTPQLNSDNFTIGFWTKWDAQTNQPGSAIIEKWDNNLNNILPYAIRTGRAADGSSDGTIFFTRSYAGTTITMKSARVVGDDNWHHIAVKNQENIQSMSIFIDGVLDSTFRYSAIGSATNDSNLYIASRGGKSSFFNGAVDELKIWNIALSEEEVTNEFNETSQTTNLVAFYKFDETSGEIISDAMSTNSGAIKGCKFVTGKYKNALNCNGNSNPINYTTLRNNNPTAFHYRYISSVTVKNTPETNTNCPIFYNYEYIEQNHPEWFLNVNGNRVNWPEDSNRFVLHIRNQSFQDWAADQALQMAKNTKNNPSCLTSYNGISFDNVILSTSWWQPTLEGIITKEVWVSAFSQYLKKVKSKLNQNGYKLNANVGGLDLNTTSEMASWDTIFDSVDGILIEQPFGQYSAITGLIAKPSPAA